MGFQSTPGSEEPGDCSGPASRCGARFGFNPRPAPRSRATHVVAVVVRDQRVSIHARLRGAGRLGTPSASGNVESFQSTPGSEEPGDLPQQPADHPDPLVSIHARLRGAGRPGHARRRSDGIGVSIHARLRGAGRRGVHDCYVIDWWFQSTPGSEEPGDVCRPEPRSRAGVSIHARLRGAGRQDKVVDGVGV